MRILNDSTTLVPVDNLTPHPDNPRHGNLDALRESIRTNGFYGSLLVQASTGYVIAGNHRMAAAIAEGAAELPVTYLDVTDEEAKRILLADNRTSDLATNDTTALAAILKELTKTEEGLAGTGYGDEDLAELLAGLTDPEPAANPYTQKVISPVYQPRAETPPPVTDLMDRARTEHLQHRITAADLPPEVATFLVAAAERHTRFDYQAIAEYYAHAPADVQRLMEESALVIIDYHRAIELGFAKLNAELTDIFKRDAALDGVDLDAVDFQP